MEEWRGYHDVLQGDTKMAWRSTSHSPGIIAVGLRNGNDGESRFRMRKKQMQAQDERDFPAGQDVVEREIVQWSFSNSLIDCS